MPAYKPIAMSSMVFASSPQLSVLCKTVAFCLKLTAPCPSLSPSALAQSAFLTPHRHPCDNMRQVATLFRSLFTCSRRLLPPQHPACLPPPHRPTISTMMLILIALVFSSLSLTAFANQDTPMPAPTNPIIYADVPDISIVRVGSSYYMSSTTMHMSPGLPIMKSDDLVNWRLISYAHQNLADNDALNLANGNSTYGAGSWASSLRHHNGRFIVSTFSSTTGKTHVYTTTDPERQPWAEVSFSPMLHDHSLVFDDDGRVYMIHGGGNLRLTELLPDLSGLKPGGINETIIQNASAVAPGVVGLPAEGSQMWKVNGKYYLFNIVWPRGGMRTQIVHRADNIRGPYEGRVILQDRGIAQGGIVDTPPQNGQPGQWFAYLFQDHGAVGRIPFLVPMTWQDGWPVLGVDGKVPDFLTLPPNTIGLANLVTSDDFTRSTGDPALPLAWQWNHNPDNTLWSVSARPGHLRLTTGRVDPGFLSARNTLTQRTYGPQCSASILLDASSMKDGDFAGLGLLQKIFGQVGVRKHAGQLTLVMAAVQGEGNDEKPTDLESIPLAQTTVHLRADCDFRNRADTARFFYSLDGSTWHSIGKPLKMRYTLPHFMGYRFAIFNYASLTPGGHVDVDHFRLANPLP